MIAAIGNYVRTTMQDSFTCSVYELVLYIGQNFFLVHLHDEVIESND
jgi:hypothetical protein